MNASFIGITTGLVLGTFLLCHTIINEVRGARKDISKIHSVMLNADGSVRLSDGTLCFYVPESNLWVRAAHGAVRGRR